MLAELPLSVRAGGTGYRALIAQLSKPDRSGGASLLTFTGMGRYPLTLAAREFARAAGRPLIVHTQSAVQRGPPLDLFLPRAASDGAILLFDEADSLFGKRSEVRDGHDRFANEEVNYFIQQLARFRLAGMLMEPYAPPYRRLRERVAHRVIHFPPG